MNRTPGSQKGRIWPRAPGTVLETHGQVCTEPHFTQAAPSQTEGGRGSFPGNPLPGDGGLLGRLTLVRASAAPSQTLPQFGILFTLPFLPLSFPRGSDMCLPAPPAFPSPPPVPSSIFSLNKTPAPRVLPASTSWRTQTHAATHGHKWRKSERQSEGPSDAQGDLGGSDSRVSLEDRREDRQIDRGWWPGAETLKGSQAILRAGRESAPAPIARTSCVGGIMQRGGSTEPEGRGSPQGLWERGGRSLGVGWERP